MMAFAIWGNEPTFLGVLGIFTVLGGSLLYTLVKMSEGKAAAASSPPPPKTIVENDEEKVELVSQVGNENKGVMHTY